MQVRVSLSYAPLKHPVDVWTTLGSRYIQDAYRSSTLGCCRFHAVSLIDSLIGSSRSQGNTTTVPAKAKKKQQV